MGDLETMTVAQTHHVGCKHHLETAHSLDSTAACFKQDQSKTINHVSSVLRIFVRHMGFKSISHSTEHVTHTIGYY